MACKTDINAKSAPFFVQLSLASQLQRFAKGKCCGIFRLDFGTSLVIRPETSMENHVTLSTLELKDGVNDYFECFRLHSLLWLVAPTFIQRDNILEAT